MQGKDFLFEGGLGPKVTDKAESLGFGEEGELAFDGFKVALLGGERNTVVVKIGVEVSFFFGGATGIIMLLEKLEMGLDEGVSGHVGYCNREVRRRGGGWGGKRVYWWSGKMAKDKI